MSYITANLRQKCTIWGVTPSGFGGYTYSSPVITNCRWEDKQELFIDKNGSEATSQSIIYTDIDVALESYIYLGESNSTAPPSSAKEVKSFRKTPNLRATEYERKVIV